MKKRGKSPKKTKKHAKTEVKRICLVCKCESGRKWEECCGRCTIPC